jgi:hypothetical protein
MEKYAVKKNNERTKIEGTRYHRVVLLEQDEIKMMRLVSTPLTQEELTDFIEKRIGNKWKSKFTVFVTEVVKAGMVATEEVYLKVIGLARLEENLIPFVPEEVLEEKTVKITVTTKGIHTEEITKEGE